MPFLPLFIYFSESLKTLVFRANTLNNLECLFALRKARREVLYEEDTDAELT